MLRGDCTITVIVVFGEIPISKVPVNINKKCSPKGWVKHIQWDSSDIILSKDVELVNLTT